MKKIVLSLLVCGFAGLFAASCIQDRGSSNIGEPDAFLDVKVKSFNDMGLGEITYNIGETLTIEPEVDGDTEGCMYKWFVIEGLKSETGLNIRDTVTIAWQDTPNLDLLLLSPTVNKAEYPDIDFDNYFAPGWKYPLIYPSDYQLYFEIWKDDKCRQMDPILFHLLPGDAKMTLQWFILKDSDGYTDFDFYDPLDDDETTPGIFESLQSNVLATEIATGNLKLPPTYSNPEGEAVGLPVGAPVALGYMPTFALDFERPDVSDQKVVKFWSKVPVLMGDRSWVDGGLEEGGGSQGVLLVVSSDDIYAVDIVNRKLIANTNGMFPGDHGKFLNFTSTQLGSDYSTFHSAMMYYSCWATMDNSGSTEPGDHGANMHVFSIQRSTGGTLCKFWGPSERTGEGAEERLLNNLHKEFFRGYTGVSLVFDLTTNSFLFSNNGTVAALYNDFPDNESKEWLQQTTPPEGMPSLTNMEYKLKTLANDEWSPKDGAASHVLALMEYAGEDPERAGEHMLLMPAIGKPWDNSHTGNIGLVMPVYPFETKHVIPMDEGELNILKEGAKIHLNGATLADVWVAYGNKFYKYLPYDEIQEGQQRETVTLELPASEEIVYFYQYSEYHSNGDIIRKVVVSNDTAANKWHVRVYDVGQTDGSSMTINNDLTLVDNSSTALPGPTNPFLLEHFWGDGKASKAMLTSNIPRGSFFN